MQTLIPQRLGSTEPSLVRQSRKDRQLAETVIDRQMKESWQERKHLHILAIEGELETCGIEEISSRIAFVFFLAC
jgi:hypothetical protein